MAFYRFTRACRQVVINYLQARFNKSEKHWDGSEWVELPSINVLDANAYTTRELPAVVTDTAMGSLRTLSFNHVIHTWRDSYGLYGPRGSVYEVFGGRGDFDVTLYCGANDRELQQKLADVTVLYLTIGRGWLWYYRHVLLGDVRILGDGTEGDVQQEKVWYANLTIPASADWRLVMPRDVIKGIDFEMDLVTPDDPFTLPENIMDTEPGLVTPLDPEDAREQLENAQAAENIQMPNLTASKDLLFEGPETDLPLRPMRSNKDVKS